jgi:hypothetical protein
MLADVASDRARIEVIGARRRIADDHVDGLAAVEAFERLGANSSRNDTCGEENGTDEKTHDNLPTLSVVMPGLVPGIHVFVDASKTWMAGTSPAMTMWMGHSQSQV